MAGCCGWSGALRRSSTCAQGTPSDCLGHPQRLHLTRCSWCVPIQSRLCRLGLWVYIGCSPASICREPSLVMIAEAECEVPAYSTGCPQGERGLVLAAHPLIWPAEAAPVPMLCCAKERLEELEHAVGLQPLLVHFVVLLELWTLHVHTSISRACGLPVKLSCSGEGAEAYCCST